jgi:hypothetical protein
MSKASPPTDFIGGDTGQEVRHSAALNFLGYLYFSIEIGFYSHWCEFPLCRQGIRRFTAFVLPGQFL